MSKSAHNPFISRTRKSSPAGKMLLLALLLIAGSVLSIHHAIAAQGGSWIIKRVSGQVYLVAPEVPAFRAKVGMELQKGMTIATRGGARAQVARGTEIIMVGPNTTFALSRYRSNGGMTTLLQKTGQVTVDVEKRSRPHFVVETPFLAAVVKGTRFSVRVGGKSASVSVERGLVGVDDFASGDQTDLGPGQRASTAPERKVGLTVAGPTKPTVRKGTPKAPSFETPKVRNVPASAPAAADRGKSLSSNAGGNGKGNSRASNAGGNSKGNSGNSNAGGNGNGNSGGSNAGGNGNGNSGGSNAGGNGNGNSGNSNAGGNGNGRGNN